MMRRSPARFFAPIALVAVVVALFLIVSAGSSSDEEPVGGGGQTTTSTTSTTEKKPASSGKKGRRTYTVQSGDTPSGIAEKTGVPLDQILDLNPDIESDALAPGTKLKLR